MLSNDASSAQVGRVAHGAGSPMPQAAGQLSLSTHKGIEFTATFNKKNPRILLYNVLI
ncbi:hypothetical protein [Komarekiella delphini-convector]|uniref:hypothetical protein n=1 Tax=Komarekiella delphini-convector TaxID=3050158 RepID=UPI001787108F|nr:hypothetical protein [Komarekiella delphini-convector]